MNNQATNSIEASYLNKVKSYRRQLESQAFALQKMGDDLYQVSEEIATDPEGGNVRSLSGICKAAIDAYNAANERQRELLDLDWVAQRLAMKEINPNG